jgi:hypothetical protein
MRSLSAAEMLHVWERGQARPAAERALALLAAACPEETPDDLAGLPVGRRDARLMVLREWTFGPRLASVAACPACGDRLEISAGVADLLVPVEEPAPERLELEVGEHRLTLRLPDSRDLAALAARAAPNTLDEAGDLPALRRLLLGRCLLAASNGPPDDLPDEVVEAAAARLAEADPQADVRLSLSCPACGHAWLAVFDIATFFWQEIEAWALRTLREVHTLALAYGWREPDILALSPWRRQIYLQMVGG